MTKSSIQCVVVLYKSSLIQSATIQALLGCCYGDSNLARKLSVLIYDNSPAPLPPDQVDWPFQAFHYRHDAHNGGLAAAYNCALRMAQRNQTDWLLLLDQDTAITPGLFQQLLREIEAPAPQSICAIVPRLSQSGIILSPHRVRKFWTSPVEPTFSGTSSETLTSLNSASALRVQAVADAGGFPSEYRIEYLDHIIFNRLQAAGGRVFVIDVTIQHRLSVMNMQTDMTYERYSRVLAAEWQFTRETGLGGGIITHRLRLLKRSLSFALTVQDKRFALQTLRAAFS